MSLADTLNAKDVWPHVKRSKVSLWGRDPRGNVVKATHEGEGYVDPHPEGEDRGGYVVFWEVEGETALYDETKGEWYEG